jgi:hypothetical protein
MNLTDARKCASHALGDRAIAPIFAAEVLGAEKSACSRALSGRHGVFE